MVFFGKQNRMPAKYWVMLCCVIMGWYSCSSPSTPPLEQQAIWKEKINKLYRNKNEDSLKQVLQHFTQNKNEYGMMLCYKQLGHTLRERAQFSKAINYHQESLKLALKLKDTLEIVQALNNLGTDFRRIGAQGNASSYHYKALNYAEAFSQANVPGQGMKNRVISLNGIGNVSLTLGYLDDAERSFRQALGMEIHLNSNLGQAINYANIGAIFEQRDQLDSAYSYYEKSLLQNKIAKSNLGIGLCLIHIGNLMEKEHNYTEAKNKYQEAYNLMYQISDKWHWLVATLSIARIHLLEGSITEFDHYIKLAEQVAKQINSPEHLSEIHDLQYKYYIKHGDYKHALQHYIIHKELQDSVQGIQKSNRFLDVRVQYEQDRSSRIIQENEYQSKARQDAQLRILYISWFFFLVGLVITALLYYAYRQRSRSNTALKQLEQTRTDFFTNITHEFRTPLTVIQGFNTILRDRHDITEKEKNTYRVAIERQCNNLLNLVNQLLDMSKLKSGAQTPEWRRGDIISYLRMSTETFKLYADNKRVNLNFYAEIDALEMDFIPFYMDKIVSNLLSNAIKYTDAGDKINFIVMKGKRTDTICIRVADTGKGMPKEDLKRIFELFYQSPNAKNTIGTGIGLSFTQMMVEKMKGQIEVESEVDKGTVFSITLPTKNKSLSVILPLSKQIDGLKTSTKAMPLAPEDNDLTVREETQMDETTLPIVLIVEDNKDVRYYLKTLLNGHYTLITAKNGEEGIKVAEEKIPDLIITDIMMPVKDGMQLCHEVKKNVILSHIPVIMLTAKTNPEDRVRGLQCGADAFIKKPFYPEELFACIQNILEGRKKMIVKYKNTLHQLDNNAANNIKVESDENYKFLQTITDLIYAEMRNPALNTSFIADKMAVSTSQLNRKLNGIIGQSTTAYILQVKLNKAKKLLSNTTDAVAEVAETCGFGDANYFSRVFKKEFGLTPSQYQKMPFDRD